MDKNNYGVHFSFVSDGLTSDERKVKIEEMKRKKNEFLRSIGYTLDENGKILSRDIANSDGFIGFAIGDALGVPVKNMDSNYFKTKPLYDMIGYGFYNVPRGTWSENTSLMLSIVDSICENGNINFNDMINRMSNWEDYNNFYGNNMGFNLSNSVSCSINKYDLGNDAINCGSNVFLDNSCLVRILPVIYYLNSMKFSYEDSVDIINSVCSLTHSNEICCLGCMIYCDYMRQLINGMDKISSLEFVRGIEYNKYYSEDSINYYKRILIDDISKITSNSVNTSNNVVDTLEASLWCLINTDSFEKALIMAVNLGGDTNTIGAIAGSMAGILYGVRNIPSRWMNKLKRKEYIDEMCMLYNNFLNYNFNGKGRS